MPILWSLTLVLNYKEDKENVKWTRGMSKIFLLLTQILLVILQQGTCTKLPRGTSKDGLYFCMLNNKILLCNWNKIPYDNETDSCDKLLMV